MRGPALLPMTFALVMVILAPAADAQIQGAREEGPTEIRKCQTISQPGSYKLINNLNSGSAGDCLVVTVGNVTIDLAGFLIISGGSRAGTGVKGASTVRNGFIEGFGTGVGGASIVEGLQVFGCGSRACTIGISATGIVKNNIAIGLLTGIVASGVITGNYAFDNGAVGIEVSCPSNVTDNTAVNNTVRNLVLNGEGCNNTNNVAP